MVLGLFERDGDYISGAEDNATFDGKTLGEFYRTDYRYFDDDRNPKDFFVDSLTGTGPRAAFFAPLREAGISPQRYQFFANEAGIKNVNSKSDLDQIIAAFEEDRRQPQKMEDEMVAAPMMKEKPMTMAGKYLGFF